MLRGKKIVTAEKNVAAGEKVNSEPFDLERRRTLKKILLGGAVVGSTAMFGNLFVPALSRNILSSKYSPGLVSFAVSGGASYPSSTASLPKPSDPPSLLYVGSLQQGTPSLQLSVIAGILARTTPVIYMTSDSFVDGNIQNSLTKHYGVIFDTSSNTSDLISTYGPGACGSPARWIRYETDYSSGTTLGQNEAVDQVNAVRTLCGVYNALPVPAGETPPIDYSSTPLYDISTWGTGVALYQKVWSMVSGSVTKQWLAINPPAGGSIRLDMTDYMIMSQAFSFQVPLVELSSTYGSVSSQKNFAATVINAYPIPYVVLGYVGLGEPNGGSDEVDFVSALSGGSSATGSALSGSTPSAHGGGYYTATQLTSNMSVKSAFAPFSGASFPNPAAIPTYSSSQKYITIIASQGDTLDWTDNAIANYMLECQNAGLPIGLTMTQVSQWLDPPVVHWYIDNIASTSGIVTSGSAGIGYNHVTQLPNISQYLGTAASFASIANVKDFFFIDGPGVNPLNSSAAVASEYITGLQSGGITPRALWWWSPTGVSPSVVDETPCFFTALNISDANLTTQSQCNTAVENAIKSAQSNFIVVFLNTTWPTPSYLKSACSSYKCTPLSPGTFANLFRSSQGLPQV